MATIVFKDDQPEQHLVFAEVYAPMRPDSDGEFMTAEEIQKMAHEFAKTMALDQVDVQHDNQTVPGVQIVESFIARKGDPDFLEGAWVVGVHVPDDALWQKIKKGEINGFSMEALVNREEQDVELEIPPVISGATSKSADHTHQFFVTYDADGTFQGGMTDSVNGHRHVIRAGTITETAQGHNHMFSSVDNLQITK